MYIANCCEARQEAPVPKLFLGGCVTLKQIDLVLVRLSLTEAATSEGEASCS